MTNIHLIEDQKIIESIIIDGQTALISEVYDRYFDSVHQYLLNYSKDHAIAAILSHYAMRMILLNLPNYTANQTFTTFAYTNAYKVCKNWIEKKENSVLDRKKIASYNDITKEEIKANVLKSVCQIQWNILADYFKKEELDDESIQQQLPSSELLSEYLKLDRGETILVLMNVWSILAIQYSNDYKESFSYFTYLKKESTTNSALYVQYQKRKDQVGQSFTPLVNIRKNLKKLGKKLSAKKRPMKARD